MKLGIALSGGGVRGSAHIGILKALEENGIRPQYISEDSAGSIVAALYSVGYTSDEMQKIALNFGKNLIDFDFMGAITFLTGIALKKKVKIDGLIRGDRIEKLMEQLTAVKGITNIADTKVPLAISSVDINTSQIVMFASYELDEPDVVYDNKVKISEAVRASISFPFLFKPKMIKGRRLIDGGVRENVPARVLKLMGADRVIAVNLGYSGEHEEDIDNIIEISNQTIDIMAYSIFKCKNKSDIDYLITPRIYNVKLLEVDRINEYIDRGYKYALSIISDIKEKLNI